MTDPAAAFFRRSRFLSLIAGEDDRHVHLRIALFLALLLHLLLIVLLPDFRDFNISAFKHNTGINVFLAKPEEPEPFEQTLNQLLPLPDEQQPLVEPAPGASNPALGDQSIITEQSPEIKSRRSDMLATDADTSESASKSKPTMFITSAMVKIFAAAETLRHGERNPEEFERFQRSFNSRAQYRRRNRAESYKNRYGDYYVRASSSEGDICFVQRPEAAADDFITNTVYFFRCGKKPKGFRIGSGG